MKIYIFHGPGESAKRARILKIKSDFDPLSVGEYSSKEGSFQSIIPLLSSGSLFAQDKLVILNDFPDVDFGKLSDDGLTIILNFSKTLGASSELIKNPPKGAAIVSFEEEKETSIFPFLDQLSEKNPKALLTLDKYLDEWGGQYVLTMLSYNLRRFIQNKNTPAFVAKKIEIQKKNFPLEKIRYLYKRIIETDFKIKQGLIDERVGLTLLSESFLH